MSISLTKGENVNLTKTDGSLTRVKVGLGWKTGNATDFDLDASAFLLNAEHSVVDDKGFVFFNNRASSNGAVTVSKDNREGTAEGDDETITIDLAALPNEVQSIDIVVTIHEAAARKQNFGQVTDAYVRLVNDNTGFNAELVRFDLDEDASSATAMVFGTLYLRDGDWKFKANAAGAALSLADLAKTYGVA